jgi:hypothetical protein
VHTGYLVLFSAYGSYSFYNFFTGPDAKSDALRAAGNGLLVIEMVSSDPFPPIKDATQLVYG